MYVLRTIVICWIVFLAAALGGCSKYRSSGQPGCLDNADGVDYTSFVKPGETSTKRVGDPCEAAASPWRFKPECSTGLCNRDGRGGTFCTDRCKSDADCGALACKSFHIDELTLWMCIPRDLEWCSKSRRTE